MLTIKRIIKKYFLFRYCCTLIIIYLCKEFKGTTFHFDKPTQLHYNITHHERTNQ